MYLNSFLHFVLVREISSCSTFLCGDGECLESDILRCDFYMDCTDGTDEMDCPCDTFRCNDSRCLSSISWRCDEEEHCTDGEDELDCAVTTQGTVTVSTSFYVQESNRPKLTLGSSHLIIQPLQSSACFSAFLHSQAITSGKKCLNFLSSHKPG